MGKRKVTILDPAVEEVARIALYIEGEGLPKTVSSTDPAKTQPGRYLISAA